jgi:hypothetical protein
MASAMSRLATFIGENQDKLDTFSDFNSASKVWNGTDVCGLLQVSYHKYIVLANYAGDGMIKNCFKHRSLAIGNY